MPDKEPIVYLRDALKADWDNTNTSLTEDPRIHTGWYDESSTSPQITITNPNENAINGGNTGYSGMNPSSGSASQIIDGVAIVNSWAGTREDLQGEGSGGADINPKQLRWEMKEEIERIARSYSSGYTSGGTLQLTYIVPRNSTAIVETDDRPHAVYRYETRVGYGYGPVSE